MTETNRPTTPAAEELLGLYFPVLDHGFVSLVDYMGGDADVARAARVSFGNHAQASATEDRNLIRYLHRNKHSSPFEMVELKFHCSMPIFVARQWIRHRTANVNEFSGRYSVMPMLFYTPPAEQLRPQSKTNKQGREDGTFSDVARTTAYEGWRDLRETTVQHYEWLIANDFARELARIDLPLSTYTQWYWKIDLHNLLHFLTLRVDSHAQWEIQQFGKVMAGMLKRVAPLAYEAWVDYDVCGARLSRAEVHVLRLLLRVDRVVRDTGVRFVGHAYGDSAVTAPEMSDLGMSKREVDEFCDRLEDGDHTTPDFSLNLSAAKPASYFEAEAATASKPRDTCGVIK